MKKNNLRPLERIQKQTVALQAALNDLSTSVHNLYLGELQDATSTLEDKLTTDWIKNQTRMDFDE